MLKKKTNFYLLCLSLLTLFSACSGKKDDKQQVTNESKIELASIELADPCVYVQDGVYYLYGTGGDVDNGFLVYTSTDLENWEGPKGVNDGYALVKGESYGTQGFWAPQVFKYNNKIYMAYTANEQIAIAESDSPLGPFKQTELKHISSEGRQIDPYVFFDEDGKIYMYHVKLQEANKLFVSEMKSDLSDVKSETAKLCIKADQAWEDTASAEWTVTEGPTVLKHKGLYYFFYSANDFRNPDYAVGYATSTSPTGPWTKNLGNPILDRSLVSKKGTGHGDFFLDKEGNLKYVFHIHNSDSVVNPRKTGIIDGRFISDESGIDYMKLDSTKVYYPAVK